MIILPSRNGMLLRNSNGIISSDCGGFTCACSLLEGDNSTCYDTDATPSTYVLSWTGVQYCLDYVSGNTWSKTVGDIVVTLNLSSASETASITVVDNGTTIFSGTNTGTSCIHRWTGTMDNTVSPSSWGTVTYSNNCTQPEFSCPCTPETGDLNGAFTTNETPGTYIAVIDDHYYCLEYISDDDNWSVTVGDLTITLDLFASATTSSLTVVDDGDTVYLGYYAGTSGIHRWAGDSMTNTVEGSDWETGSYYTTCNQTTSSNCAVDCDTTSGCSCFLSGTPTKYFVIFANITFCLTYVSGCTWQATYGDLTITLNLTHSSSVARLTIVDGATTVFSGDVTDTDCGARLASDVNNSLTNDWGSATYFPACSDTTCYNGRLLKIEFLDMAGLVFANDSAYSENYSTFPDELVFWGYLLGGGSSCYMYLSKYNPFLFDTYLSTFPCTLSSSTTEAAFCDVAYNSFTQQVTVSLYGDFLTNPDRFTATGSLPLALAVGGSVELNNAAVWYTGAGELTCSDYDYTTFYGTTVTASGKVKITAF